MSLKFKGLGVALFAVLLMGAVGVSGASAHKLITSTGGSVDLTGVGVEAVWGVKTGALQVKCSKETFSGTTLANNAATFTITPKYEGCNGAPFGASPVHVNGCDFVLHGDTTTSPTTTTGTKTDMPLDIVCPAGQSITVTTPGCTIHTDPQTGLHGLGFANEGTGATADIKLTMTIDNFHYTTAGGFICSLGGLSTTGNDGFLTGSATFRGYKPHSEHKEADHVGISFGEVSVQSFHSEAAHTVLIGEATLVEQFIANAGSAECSESGYKGTMSSATPTEITLSPEYAECDAFGFASAEIKPNGCAYKLLAGSNEGGKLEGSATIECPEGKSIEVIAKSRGLLKCTVTIGAQAGLKNITYTNSGSGSTRHVQVDLGMTGVKYTQDAGEGLGKCEGGAFSNGEISGRPTVIAESSEKKQLGFWVE